VLVSRFYTGDISQRVAKERIDLPAWLVKGPPFLVLALLLFTIVLMAYGNHPGAAVSVGPESFKGVVTFGVTVLNATTIMVMGRVFRERSKDAAAGSVRRSPRKA
jgi:hypothetical protein